MKSIPVNAQFAPARAGRGRRVLLWGALLALLVVAQGLLLALTLNYESTRAQDGVEQAASESAAGLRSTLLRTVQALQSLAVDGAQAAPDKAAALALNRAAALALNRTAALALNRTAALALNRTAALALMRAHSSLGQLELRDNNTAVQQVIESPVAPGLFAKLPRADLQIEAEWACAAARRSSAPTFSRSYFVPMAGGQGQELIDLCIPLLDLGREVGFLVASLRLPVLLETTLTPEHARRHEFSIVEADGTRVARSGHARGAGVYQAERVVDLPGTPLLLRADSVAGRPSLVPNLATALVLGLSLALFAVVLLLARDVRRRAQAERALADALAFRQAMEDSLSTGLRARDLQGVVTYANPAFCAMVGYSAQELRAAHETQPYWPAESLDEYRQRQHLRLASTVSADNSATAPAREGFETVFVRKNGERFPVMVYEAPLVDSQRRHTGWMSAVLDLSAQRRVEELSRQQQERLQATARLATVGEMASLLSHELNQPLAAIASYASGSLNVLSQGDADTPALLQQALTRIVEQAERAGRVIKSVHDFVRRREQQHETVAVDTLLQAVLPLVRLQARKSATRVEVDIQQPLQSVRCDRTMVEQVLLNLARNGIQAMEAQTPLAKRVLLLRAADDEGRGVRFAVIDAGPGVAPDVAVQLFTPFFTTRAEGMGLGLSLCRTVVEQHGGTLDFGPGPGGVGSSFSFTLPWPRGGKHHENSDTAALKMLP